MLNDLPQQKDDPIIALSEAFRSDPREDKVDLGVGVFRDADGNTPVMRAVKAAERRLVERETTKSYTKLAGDPAFADAMRALVLGDAVPTDRVAHLATPGGTGAVRQAAELVAERDPGATVWVPDPTWPNHNSILDAVGLTRKSYRYFDSQTLKVDTDGMLADLGGAAAGDVVILHGCCHNPTGADPDAATWDRLADILAESGATPLLDAAYLGFGDGLDADAAGLRTLAARLPQMLLAVSCSKNFGVYRDRVGILFATVPDPADRANAQAFLGRLNRQAYSFPPDHGARAVTEVLTDADLRADWESELSDMRAQVNELRAALADELRRRTNSDRFDFLTSHAGMFSRIGATPDQVEAMRRDHGIYMVSDGRINVAGLSRADVPQLATAMLAAGL